MQSPIQLDPLHEIGASALPCPTGGAGLQTSGGNGKGDLHRREGLPVCGKKTVEDIIEEVCGEMRQTENKREDVLGYVTCPGEHLHNHRTASRDAAVIMPPNSLPIIRCFHDSCRELVSSMSEELRMRIEDAALAKDIDFSWSPASPESMEIWSIGKNAEKGAANKRGDVIRVPWTPASIAAESPESIPEDGYLQGTLLLSLFDCSDVVWIGEPWHSGKEKHSAHFRTATEWADAGMAAWFPFITGSTYLPGAYSRGNGSVLKRKFLIAESDNLDKGQTGAVLRHIREMGYPLRAVVDSGRRSLHGWFNIEGLDEECVAMLEGMLRGFGMDAKTMRPAQPVRMAGFPRIFEDGRAVQQSLLYLDRK